MPNTPQAQSSLAGRQFVSTVAQGASAGGAGGLMLPSLFPGIATLIAAQADGAVAYGLLLFICVQIGVAAAILCAFVGWDPASSHRQ